MLVINAAGAELRQLVGVLARAQGIPVQLIKSPPSFSYDAPPPVPNRVFRDSVVTQALAQFQQRRMLALVARSAAFGKTQLGLMIAASRAHTWARIRRRSADEAASIVADAAKHALVKRHELLVLDDLGRLVDADPVSEELLLLARKPFQVLITSAFPLPAQLRSALGSGYAEFSVPPFSKEETRQLLMLSEAPPHLMVDAVVDFIQSVSHGHPWLMQAMMTYLRQRDWTLDEKTLRGIFQGEHVTLLRDSVQQMLRETVPDEVARELLYRLEFVLGSIGREQIETVADIPRPIILPFEKLRDMRGLWIQQETGGRWQLSPLLAGLGRENLGVRMAQSIQITLADLILARETITAIDVDRGIRYLLGAEAHDRAGSLYVMALSSFLDEASTDVPLPPVLSRWLGELPPQMSASIKAFVRALQVRLLDSRGGDASQYVAEIEVLIGRNSTVVAEPVDALAYVFAAMTAGTLRNRTNGVSSIRLLRMAITHFKDLKLPGGDAIPEELTSAIYGSIWLGAVVARTPAVVLEWLILLRSLSREQLMRSMDSEWLARSSMYFIPRVLVMEEEKRKDSQDWLGVEKILIDVADTGASVGLPLLAAAACAARVVLLAEHRRDVDAAVKVARHALELYGSEPDAEFILSEALGTQLVLAQRPTEAIVELERAAAIDFKLAPVSRIHVFIHLGVLTRNVSVESSLAFIRQAVALAKKDQQVPRSILVGVLAELAMALGDTQGVAVALEPWSEGVAEVLAQEPQTDFDKGVYARFGHCLGYYTSLARTGRPPSGLMDGGEYGRPVPGLFLRDATIGAAMYHPGLRPLLAAYVGMYADAIGNGDAAVSWSRRAAESVSDDMSPETRAILVLTVLPFQLLNGAFEEAITSGVETGLMLAERAGKVAVGPMSSKDPGIRKRAEATGRAFVLLPSYLRVATLKLENNPLALIEAQKLVDACRERARQSGDVGWKLAASVIEKSVIQTVDRKELLQIGTAASQAGDEQLKEIARLATSLHPDVSPAEAIAAQFPVLYQYQAMGAGREGGVLSRLIVFQFIAVYWRNAVERSGFQFAAPRLFRTSIEDASEQGGTAGVRSLLRAVLDSLSIRVPDYAREWLRGH